MEEPDLVLDWQRSGEISPVRVQSGGRDKTARGQGQVGLCGAPRQTGPPTVLNTAVVRFCLGELEMSSFNFARTIVRG